MSPVVAFLLGLPPALVLAAALVLPAVEAAGFVGLVIPGETAVFVAGLTSRAGHLPLWAVMASAAAGAVAGDQVGFLLGRRWGPSLIDRLPRRLTGTTVTRTLAMIRRRGAWAVLLGRWTAVLRALVPGLAGASGMRRRDFTAANLAGGSTWAVVVAALGYGAGAAYQQVIATVGRAGEIGVGVIVLGLLVVVLGRRVGRRLAPSEPAALRGSTVRPAAAATRPCRGRRGRPGR